MKLVVSRTATLLFMAVLVGFAAHTTRATEMVELSGRAMGTTWAVKFIQPAHSLEPDVISARVAERLEQLESQFSTYRTNSELSRFNAATTSTEWFPVSAELARLALEARAISELTGGVFDVTVDPLVRLWGFGPTGRRGVLPTATEIAAARTRVNWTQLDGRNAPPALRRLRPGITADFSSIAKGFSSDAIGALLSNLGAPNHLVQIGGDVKARGGGADGGGWRAGIETPDTDHRRPMACVVNVRDEALSTSGSYRNFVAEGGRRYGHLIDPRTGAPADSDLASVSVVHDSCATSSALATALFVMGTKRGFEFATRQKLAGVFFVSTANGFERRVTPEFAARMR